MPVCKMCKGQYAQGGKEPLTLECKHVFCKDCLTKAKKQGGGSFKCQSCRKPYKDLDLSKLKVVQDMMESIVSSASEEASPTTTDPIPIVIKNIDNRTYSLKIHPESTIKQMKDRLSQQCGIESDKIALIYLGKALEDQNTLRHYNIGKANIIQMSQKYVGGSHEY